MNLVLRFLDLASPIFPLSFLFPVSNLVLDDKWFNVPNAFGILIDATITAKESHPGNGRDTLLDPTVLILECFVDQLVGFEIGVEIVGNEVVVSVVFNGVDEGGKGVLVAKSTGVEGIKDSVEFRVELVFTIVVIVAEVFDVFGEVAKEEDVLVAGFTSDLDLD